VTFENTKEVGGTRPKWGLLSCGEGLESRFQEDGRRRQVSQEGAETSCRSRVGMPETTPPPTLTKSKTTVGFKAVKL
jgi:hypothetical protein